MNAFIAENPELDLIQGSQHLIVIYFYKTNLSS
jgi:hypothetical protein